MMLILAQNQTLNVQSATRGLNKPISRKAGFFLFGALRPESNGRFSAGCSILLVAQTALIELACLRK